MEASENLTLQDIELSELELEEYEPNELVLETVNDFLIIHQIVVVGKKIYEEFASKKIGFLKGIWN